MKRLHEKVNVIPLIAKADTLTPEECQQFKKQVSTFPALSTLLLLQEVQTHDLSPCLMSVCENSPRVCVKESLTG